MNKRINNYYDNENNEEEKINKQHDNLMEQFKTIKDQNKKFRNFIDEFKINEKTISEKLKKISIE